MLYGVHSIYLDTYHAECYITLSNWFVIYQTNVAARKTRQLGKERLLNPEELSSQHVIKKPGSPSPASHSRTNVTHKKNHLKGIASWMNSKSSEPYSKWTPATSFKHLPMANFCWCPGTAAKSWRCRYLAGQEIHKEICEEHMTISTRLVLMFHWFFMQQCLKHRKQPH